MLLSSHVRIAGRYQLKDTIAIGGFGEVWRATDTVLARPVAVKLLLADHVQHPHALARFRTEAQRAGGLSHENIARVYDYVEPEPPDPPFLVMELVDGPSAAQVMSCGPVGAAWAMHLVAGAAAGLETAHQAGVVHRDVKPANLLLTRDSRVKVTDFGISYAVNSAPVTSTGLVLGTSGYLAPERLTGTGVTAAADLYALGIVAYECLTGAPPFTGTAIEVAVAHRDQPLPPLPASVPPGVAALIMDLTAKDPAARPGSAGEVAFQAAQLRDGLTGVPGGVASAAPGAAPGEGATASLRPGHGAMLWTGLEQDGIVSPRPAPGPRQLPRPRPGSGPTPGPGAPGLLPGLGSTGLLPGPGSPGPGSPDLTAAPEPGRDGGRSRWLTGRLGLRARGARRVHGARRAGLAVGVAIVLVGGGLVTARAIGAGSPGHKSAVPAGRATPGMSTVQMIEVNAASLLGRPVGAAARQLRQLGLAVRVTWQPSRQQPPGTVLAVRPGGRVAPHTLITLTGAGQPTGGTGTFPVGGPSSGPGPGLSPAGSPSPGQGPASSPAPSASASPSPSGGKGNGKGKGNGNGKGNGKG